MRRFENLTQEDKNEVVCKAFEWRKNFANHVVGLLVNQIAWFAPSGSDLLRPELWKPAHWKWFDRGGE